MALSKPGAALTRPEPRLLELVLSRLEYRDCWLWTGYTDRDGYGRCSLRKQGGGWRNLLVHRVAYAGLVRDLHNGETVHHICTQRACCRPTHLQAVTQGTNTYEANTRRSQAPELIPDDLAADPVETARRLARLVVRRDDPSAAKVTRRLAHEILLAFPEGVPF